jgi:hypothetical protein
MHRWQRQQWQMLQFMPKGKPYTRPPVHSNYDQGQGKRRRRFLLYSPCVVINDPSYCAQQFNNQLFMLQVE